MLWCRSPWSGREADLCRYNLPMSQKSSGPVCPLSREPAWLLSAWVRPHPLFPGIFVTRSQSHRLSCRAWHRGDTHLCTQLRCHKVKCIRHRRRERNTDWPRETEVAQALLSQERTWWRLWFYRGAQRSGEEKGRGNERLHDG